MSLPRRDNKFTAFFRPRPRSRPRPPLEMERPISSATHSTIAPLPSDAFKRQRTCHDACDDTSDDPPRKLALSSFFGFALSRRSSPSSDGTPKPSTSRNRSFRLISRPATPKSVDSSASKSPHPIPVPSSPLPLSASPRRRSFGLGSHRSTPKSSSPDLPLPISHLPRSHARRHSVGSERPPHDSAVALAEEPSHRTVHNPPLRTRSRNRGKVKEVVSTDQRRSPHQLSPSIDSASRSLPPDPSPTSCNLLSLPFAARPSLSHLPTVDSASSEENDPLPLPIIPQIIHTPPTPQRFGADVDPPSRPNTTLPPVTSKSKCAPIALVPASQPHPNVHRPTSSKPRFTPRFLGGKDVLKSRDADPQKPSPPDPPIHKAPVLSISGPVRNMTNNRSKLGSFDFERPVSALNKSSSTVNTHVPANNSKIRLHSLERSISEDSARGGKSSLAAPPLGHAESPASSQLGPDHVGAASVISLSSISLQTKSTGIGGIPAGQSSSWGRASGRRIFRTSHGTFAFEHPSSVPSSPDPRPFNLPNDLSEHTPGLAQSLPPTPLHAILDPRGKHSRGQSHNTLDHVETSYSASERKAKGKGRSLDLGLGLSWAPSRLREDVLMPGLILAREKEKTERNKSTGSNVTKTFESLLSESRFQAFKKYVRRFDAHTIPLEGPSGLLARVEKLLAESGLDEQERKKLMSEFTVFVENHNE